MSYTLTRVGSAAGWNQSKADMFWGEIAPCKHVLQVYKTEETFISTLTGFVGTGINSGDCVIVIATTPHLHALNERLQSSGVHIATLMADDRYIPLSAEVALSAFMKNGMPDENAFHTLVYKLLQRAQSKGRKLRAFGEMVALLWMQGNKEATVKLEQLWTDVSQREHFNLFCAYPEYGFTEDISSAAIQLTDICNCHTTVIDGAEPQLQDVYFRS